jgi:hypothetical protein
MIYLIGPTESVLTQRGNRFPNLAEYLVEKGGKVCYLTTNHYHAEKRHFNDSEIEQAVTSVNYELVVFRTLGYTSNISIRRITHNVLMSWKMYLWLSSKDLQPKDILIIPSRPVELIFAIGFLKRAKGFRSIMDVQDIWPDALSFMGGVRYKLFKTYCDFFLKRSLKSYSWFLLVAPSFENWVKRYTSDSQSVFVPLGWENNRWQSIGNKIQHSRKIEVVCVAKLQLQIDVLPFIKALGKTDSIRLTIIGEDGSGDRYNEVNDYLERSKSANVSFISSLSRENLANELTLFDIGLVPMITTSIPNKVFDYMAAGLPQIVLGNNDSSAFVEREGLGWSCSFNEDDIVNLLERLDKNSIQAYHHNVLAKRHLYSRNELFETINSIITQ